MRVKTLNRVRLPNQSIRVMRDVLLEAGADAGSAFQAAGLEPAIAERPQATVSGAQELAFQRAFVDATASRPDLWLRVGWCYSLLTMGALGLAALTAPTIDVLAATLLEFADFTFWLDTMREVRSAEGEVIGIETVLRDVPADLREFTVYRNLGMSMRVLGEVWHGAAPPLSVIELPLPVLPFDRCPVIGTPVIRGRAARWLWEPDAGMELSPSHNPLLHRSYLQQCTDDASRLKEEETVADQVREVLATATQRAPTLPSVAVELHLSVRSLQRMLRIEGVSYRDLQREARTHAAQRMLISTHLAVGEIARRLGYRDSANFCAAFRQWTGATPTEWRATHARTEAAGRAA